MKYLLLVFMLFSSSIRADESLLIKLDKSLYTKQHQKTIKYFDSSYKVEGSYRPKWMGYVSNKEDYKSGFHESLDMCLTQLPLMGTDTIILNKIKSLKTKSISFQNGFYAGLEAYSAYSYLTTTQNN